MCQYDGYSFYYLLIHLTPSPFQTVMTLKTAEFMPETSHEIRGKLHLNFHAPAPTNNEMF